MNTNAKETASRQNTEDETEGTNSTVSINGSNDLPTEDDATLIREAEEARSEECYFIAARLLRQVSDQALLKAEHRYVLKWAAIAEEGMKELLESPEQEGSIWKKQTESHKHRDFLVYYHVTDSNRLINRIDSVVESSLLVPLLSVLNETDLYKTWMPSYKKPIKLGIDESKMLKEEGRGNQIIQTRINMAWPFAAREVIQHAVAMDAIDEAGSIVVQVITESPKDDPTIPEPDKNVVRMELECTIVIQGCAPDHPILAKSKHKYPEGESLININLRNMSDAHVTGVPIQMINFVTRTVLGRLWSALLQVAEDVRDGKRPLHQEAIAKRKELYDWTKGRVKVMLDKLETPQDKVVGTSS